MDRDRADAALFDELSARLKEVLALYARLTSVASPTWRTRFVGVYLRRAARLAGADVERAP